MEKGEVSYCERLADKEARTRRVGGDDGVEVRQELGNAAGTEVICAALSLILLVLVYIVGASSVKVRAIGVNTCSRASLRWDGESHEPRP